MTENPLRHPPFTLAWSSRVFSTLAFHMQAVAVGWQVYSLTGRAFDLGLVGLAQFLPMILLTLLVGHAADRYNRRTIVSVCQFVEGAAAATLVLGSFGGWLSLERILAIVAVGAAGRAFEGPTISALMPSLVPRPLIPRASAWLASANQTAQIVGPALGGLLYALGPTAAFGTGAALFMLAAVFAALVPGTRADRARDPVLSSRSSPGWCSSARTGSCSASSRSTSSPSSSAA